MLIHRVPCWVVRFEGRDSSLIYAQSIALDAYARPDATAMEMMYMTRPCRDDPTWKDADERPCYMCAQPERFTAAEEQH